LKLILDNSVGLYFISLTNKNERLASKVEGKTNFSRQRRLSGTGIVDFLEIINVGRVSWNSWWLDQTTLTPKFYDRSTPLFPVSLSIDIVQTKTSKRNNKSTSGCSYFLTT